MLLTDHLCQNMSSFPPKNITNPPSRKKNVSVGNDVWVPPSNKKNPEIWGGGAPAYSSPKT